jgi:transposase
MIDSTTTIAGLDVHKASIRLAVVRGDRLLRELTLPHNPMMVSAELHALGVSRCCYEAGLCGFGLARHLIGAGIDCEVVAPSLIPVRPGDRVKTDARDARTLARLYLGGLLVPVWIPTLEIEALRDLVRAREDARCDRMRQRQRLGSFLIRHGRVMPTTIWGPTRRHWLSSQTFENPMKQATFDDYLMAVDLAHLRVAGLDRTLDELSKKAPYTQVVGKLRCLRGIDTLSALGLVAEVGDFSRFSSAQKFMSYVGLVPSERSSGNTRRQGGITKTGNSHARRLLVEAAWNASRPSRQSIGLVRRREGHSPLSVARALQCERRLHRRFRRMRDRGKSAPTVAVAVARELAGFVWAIATDQPLRTDG